MKRNTLMFSVMVVFAVLFISAGSVTGAQENWPKRISIGSASPGGGDSIWELALLQRLFPSFLIIV